MFNISRFQGLERQGYGCEVVTPLFLGSADLRKAELRVPPIKAAMRFWWRALFAQEIIALKENESKLFGDCGDIYGKSKLVVTLDTENMQKGQYQPLPHHETKPKNFKIEYISGYFIINIQGTRQQHDLFQLFCVLGGIGKRSRRGFGSIRIRNIGNTLYEFSHTLENIFQLIDKVCPDEFRISDNTIHRKKCVTINNYAFIKSINIGKSYNSFQELLKLIGQASHNFNSDFTGFAKGQERFASPVYVTVNKNKSEYLPVISILNTSFKVGAVHGIDKSQEFINAVMNGGRK